MVPIEAGVSGVLQVPVSQFLGVMIGVHLVIALCEGAVTFAVIAYLRLVRPELMGLETIDSPLVARSTRLWCRDRIAASHHLAAGWRN